MKTWLIAVSAFGGIFALDIIRLSAVILKKNMGTDSMPEYIEWEAAIESIISEPQDAHYPYWYADKIKSIPAVEVAPVRHGRWFPTKAPFMNECEDCSVCGYRTVWGHRYNYCPNCGALMDGNING